MRPTRNTQDRNRGEHGWRLHPIVLLALLCLPVMGVVSCEGSAAAREKPPVVLVVFDEFPTTTLLDGSNRISRSRYPNFHRLAGQSTWYRNNTTVSPVTAQAVPAILTGQRPVNTRPDYRRYPKSIYTFMNGAGYSVRNLEIYTQLCPPRICPKKRGRVINPKKSESPHGFGRRVYESVSNRARERVRWISSLRRLSKGEIAIGHIKLPHGPFVYLPNGRKYTDSERHELVKGSRKLMVRGKPGLLETYEKRLLMQVGYVDSLVGRIISSIKKSGQWKDTTLIITSDHGVSIAPGFPRRQATRGNRFSVGLTPLFIKYPGQRSGELSEDMTSVKDLVPTIAEVLGLEGDLYRTAGLPISKIPKNRVTRINEGQAGSLKFRKAEISSWLKSDAPRRAKRMGRRGLDALGPIAGTIGGRPSGKRMIKRSQLSGSLAGKLNRQGRSSLPPLIGGYVRAPGVSNGTRLQLVVGGRVVATSTVFRAKQGLAFSFLVHPRYLKGRKLGDVRIFRVGRR